MKTNFKKTLVVTALALSSGLFAVNSQALPDMNATMAMSGLGNSTIVGTDLNNASSFTFGTNSLVQFDITTVPALAFGNPNNFYIGGPSELGGATFLGHTLGTIIGSGGSGTTLNISGFTPVANFMTWSTIVGINDTFTFNLATLTRNSTVLGAMDLYGTGTVNDSNNTYNANNPASIRLTAQNNGGSISWSASWASPPVPNHNVPEPYFMSLLGLGLAAFGFSRRRSLLRSEGQSA